MSPPMAVFCLFRVKFHHSSHQPNTPSKTKLWNTHKCTLPPKPSTILSVLSMLSTANVVRAAMLTLPSEPPEPQAWTRQPSGTWMNAPLRAAPLRNM